METKKVGLGKGHNLSVGIVGLPNVGKSTLFNALTNIQVPAENYPFCTIDPNMGIVEVPDERLQILADIVNPEKIVNAVVKFVDIAGLVKGASKGEGLGNQFLSNIREVDAIVHVVRFFQDDNVIHVNNRVDPHSDIKIIDTELALKDLETVEKRFSNLQKVVRTASKDSVDFLEYKTLEKIKNVLEKGYCAREITPSEDEFQSVRNLGLLTLKPVIYVFNTNNSKIKIKELKKIAGIDSPILAISMDIKLESDLTEMDEDDREIFMKDLEMEKSGLEKLACECYDLLGLRSYFTAGKMEVKAWTINVGETAPEAAGRIHGDFEKKFICVEVVSYNDFIECGGWQEAKKKGKMRVEGKDYVVKEGDVLLFRHGA